MKDRIKVEITNDFHNTRAAVIAVRQLNGTYAISQRAARRARNRLCGIDACTCGDYCGARPQQTEEAFGGEARILGI